MPSTIGYEVVLTIDREIVDAIVAHARRDHPEEACGVIAGPVGTIGRCDTSRWKTPSAR